jgi:hypothetical protein
MASFGSSGFHSVFIPVSWFTDVNASIEQAMVPAFRILVLERLYTELQTRTAQISDLNRQPIPDAGLPPREPNAAPPADLERLPEYLQMQAFIEQVAVLQHHISVYNQISAHDSGGSIQAIIDLDAYLQGRTSSISISEAANPYFQQAVRDATWTPFSYSSDVHKMSIKAEQLTTALYSAWIENNPTRTATDRLVTSLKALSAPTGVKYEDLVTAQRNFHSAQNIYANPSLTWVTATDFHLPPELASVTTVALAKSPFFQPWLQQWMLDLGEQDFQDLVDDLNGAETALTGRIVEADSAKLVLTDNAQDVQVALDNLLNLPFVSAKATGGRIESPSSTETILWNKDTLAAAAT